MRRAPTSRWTTTSRPTCLSCRRSGPSSASSPGRYVNAILRNTLHARVSTDRIQVLKFPDDSPYTVQATLEWESMDSFKKAAGSPSLQAVMDDVKNFADKPPKLMTGEIVGSQ